MSQVSVTQVQLLPLLSVTVGDQALLLDPDTAGELYDALSAVFTQDDDDQFGSGWTAEAYDEAWQAGKAAATYQRPTVWFAYGEDDPTDRRQVIPVTIKMGVDDVLLIGVELSKGRTDHGGGGTIKSYRTGMIRDLVAGHDVTAPVSV